MRQALRLLSLLCLLLAAQASAQSILERLVTPGPLSGAHARLEASCGSCHSSFQKEAQNGRCTACHKGVGADIAGGRGYHGKFGAARGNACKSCHSEHKGRGFSLIRLNRAGFDHGLTDYPLAGRHAAVACAGCHGNGNNYRGVPTTCAACHKKKDPHRGQLGNCQACHTVQGWKPIRSFDHASTGFGLTGAHQRVACLTCHAGQRWQGLGTTCISCHARDDAHKGSRGSNCASCHTTAAWRAVTFDHDSTGFPLLGAHAAATCTGCHGPGNANRHPSRTCFACHAGDDTHKGSNGTNCASCHNPRAWKQVSFDHDRMTRFPLKGAHRGAACKACHVQPPKVVKPPVTCFACHKADDVHKGGNGEDCAACHVESAWKKVDFDHSRMTRFALLGKHARLACAACHTRPPRELKLAMECGSCHARDDVHAAKLGSDCARCHDSNDWKSTARFDHALSRFPLLGKHAPLTCIACHADRSFAAKGTSCASCHEDKHHKGTLGTPAACGTCHNSADWKAWTFDHDRQTRFALDGRHRGLVCSACHGRPGDPARQGGRCIDCHRRDDRHHGAFGEDCASCHVTTSFREIVMPRR